jgi:hypothetical protein
MGDILNICKSINLNDAINAQIVDYEKLKDVQTIKFLKTFLNYKNKD